MTHVIDADGRIKEHWGEVALEELADWARGSIIRGGVADWEPLVHPGTAYHLQTNATDVIWAQNITMADGAWIGQAAGPLITFDDTLNYLGITGCNVGIGTMSPEQLLEVDTGSLNTQGGIGLLAEVSYRFLNFMVGNSNVNSIFWDDGDDLAFGVANVNTDTAPDTILMTIKGISGYVGIGTATPGKKLDVFGVVSFYLVTAAATNKQLQIHTNQYDSAVETEGWLPFRTTSLINTNQLILGGSHASYNAATIISFFTAPNVTTRAGTEKVRITAAGYVGVATVSPDRLLHAEASDADAAAVTYAERLTHILSSGTAAAGFGVGIEFELETATSQDVMGRLFVKLADATHATRRGTFGVDLNRQGSFHEAVRIVASDVVPVAGNARGAGAVDFGQGRGAATEVASGSFSVISGGYKPTASGWYSTVGGGAYNDVDSIAAVVGGGYGNAATQGYATVSGGFLNEAAGANSAIPGGYYGLADKYGQICSATGRFTSAGDAQGTIQFVATLSVLHDDADWYELFLNGTTAADARMTIAADTVWTFDTLIVGTTSGCAKSFGFRIEGTIENDGGTTTLLNSTVTTVYDADDVSFDARASADDANDALLIEVQDADGTGDVVQWCATTRTAEITFPA